MTDYDEHPDVTALLPLGDDAIDAFLDGDAVPEPVEHLAAFASLVRAVGDGPPPPASRALAELLVAGPEVASIAGPRSTGGGASRAPRRRGAMAKVAGIGLAAKLALGASTAAAGVVGAGAVGVLPPRADTAVRHAIEVVTPLDFADPDAGRRGREPLPAGGTDTADGTDDDGIGRSPGGENATGGHRGRSEGGHGEPVPPSARPGASADAPDPSGEGGQPGDSGDPADPGDDVPGRTGQPADGGQARPPGDGAGGPDGSYDRER